MTTGDTHRPDDEPTSDQPAPPDAPAPDPEAPPVGSSTGPADGSTQPDAVVGDVTDGATASTESAADTAAHDTTDTGSAGTETPTTGPDAAEPRPDTGRHATVRPAPVPPEPVGSDDTATTATTAADPLAPARPAAPAAPASPARPVGPVDPGLVDDPAVAAGAASAAARRGVLRDVEEPAGPPTGAGVPLGAAAAATAAAAHHDGPATAEATEGTSAEEYDFPDPNAPRTVHPGTHVLGVVVGVILTPVAMALLLLGEARILAVQADGWTASLDVLGIVLVTIGLLLLAIVLLLAIWTPAVPITGGAVLTVLGGVFLYAPGIARTQVLDVLSSSGWRLYVTQVTVAGTSGTVLVGGVLLLVAGLVAVVARRHGVRLGAFRERHRV